MSLRQRSRLTRFGDAALGEVFEDLRHERQRGVAERGQLGVEPLLAGQGDEGDPARPALAREPLEALGEVGPAAQDADDHGRAAWAGLRRRSGRGPRRAGARWRCGRGPAGSRRAAGGRRRRGPGSRCRRSSGSRTTASPHLRASRTTGAASRPTRDGLEARSELVAVRRAGGVPKGSAADGRCVREIPRPPHPRRRLRSRWSRSGLLARGPSRLPPSHPRRRGQWPDCRNAPFPLTAAGPRRLLTGFPSTGTVWRRPGEKKPSSRVANEHHGRGTRRKSTGIQKWSTLDRASHVETPRTAHWHRRFGSCKSAES